MRVALHYFDAPVCFILSAEPKYDWLDAAIGAPLSEMPPQYRRLASAVAGAKRAVFSESIADEAFFSDCFSGFDASKGTRFAAVPLFTSDNQVAGTLCVLDHEKRAVFSDAEKQVLVDLGLSAQELVESRRLIHRLDDAVVREETLNVALRDSEERLRDYANASADWYWEVDTEMRFNYLSENVTKASGKPVEWYLGRKRTDIISQFADPAVWARHLELLDRKEPFRDMIYCRPGPNGMRWLRTSGRPFFSADGVYQGYRGIVADITKEVELERSAKEAQDLLLTAVNAVDGIFLLCDSAGRVVLMNQRFREILAEVGAVGASYADILDLAVEKGLFPEARGDAAAYIANRLERRGDPTVSHALTDATGRTFQIQETCLQDGSTVSFGADITMMKAANAALSDATRAAEAASRAKTEFLSVMSHEFRTPMNGILGSAQLLEQAPETSSDKREEWTQSILRAGEQLHYLIDKVLELSYIESTGVDAKIKAIDPTEQVRGALTTVGVVADKASVRIIDATADAPMPRVLADGFRLEQVLLNLLSNAVKFNIADGAITVACVQDEPGMLMFRITDTGIGIPADKLADVFQPFNRLGREVTSIAGTGIGLTISKQLVEAMGGRIGCERAPGGGTCFWFTLPLAGRADDDLAVGSASNDYASVETHLPIKQSFFEPNLKGYVLYIEDNSDNVTLMSSVLEHLTGIEMVSLHDAESALASMKVRKPDLVLMDIRLPGMDGFEAVKRMREDPALRDVPTLAVSASVMPDQVEVGYQAGFNAYLSKPLNLPSMMRELKRFLAAPPPEPRR